MTFDDPIGMFDSGVGGLCVLERCMDKLPNERFIYLADKANMPYGERTAPEIRRAAMACADRLFSLGCKALVVACNTATETAIDDIRRAYPMRIVVGMEPAVKPCCRELGRGYAVALVTSATERSAKFKRLMTAYGDRVVAAPQAELAKRIEDNVGDIEKLRPYVYGMLEKYRDAESVILGCSHYTHITRLISDFYGGAIKIYDGADGVADRLLYCLSIASLRAPDRMIGGAEFLETRK